MELLDQIITGFFTEFCDRPQQFMRHKRISTMSLFLCLCHRFSLPSYLPLTILHSTSLLRFVIDQDSNNIAVIETDHNAYTDNTKEQRKQQMAEEMVEAAGEEEQELAAEMAAAFLNEKLPEDVFGAPKAGWGMWASQIRLQVRKRFATC